MTRTAAQRRSESVPGVRLGSALQHGDQFFLAVGVHVSVDEARLVRLGRTTVGTIREIEKHFLSIQN